MKIASANLIVSETKEDAMAKVNSVNNTATNGTNNTANNNAAATQQKAVTKPDTVELSSKSVELATTVATQSESKAEETNKQVTAKEKSKDAKTNYRQAMKQSQRELRGLVSGLKNSGMGRREIGKIIRTANREANKTIGREIKKAYNDYRSHKIDRQSFKNKLYGAAVKKLDGIVSALKNVHEQKVASADGQTVSVKSIGTPAPVEKAETPTNARKDDSKETLIRVEQAGEKKVEDKDVSTPVAEIARDKAPATTPPGQVVVEEEATEATSPELIVKEEKVVAEAEEETMKVKDSGSADNTFSQIIDIFNDIDKMINGFADKVEAEEEEEVKDSTDKGDSLVNFAAKLNDMFSGINRMFGRDSDDNVGNRLGVIGQLFDNGHGSGAINRIGDAGEGSGNFNAAGFMSSISNGINDALESYKDVQRAEKEAKEKEEAEEAVGTGA